MTATANETTTESLVNRLRKIEGQVRGLQRMVDRGDRCIDVLTQVAATRGALLAVGRGLLDCEMRRAVAVGVDDVDRSVCDVLTAVELLDGR